MNGLDSGFRVEKGRTGKLPDSAPLFGWATATCRLPCSVLFACCASLQARRTEARLHTRQVYCAGLTELAPILLVVGYRSNDDFETFKAAGYLPRDLPAALRRHCTWKTQLHWLKYTTEISACQENLKAPAGRGVWRSSPRRRCRPNRRTS